MYGSYRDAAASSSVAPHHHLTAQIVTPSRGVLTVCTTGGDWIVPPRNALWIPPQFGHSVAAAPGTEMVSLFLVGEYASHLPLACATLPVSPLLHELMRRIAERSQSDEASASAYGSAVSEELRCAKTSTLEVKLPIDRRARKLARLVMDRPESALTLQEWCETVGASARNMERIFHRDTGLSFGKWRRNARIAAALNFMAAGDSIGVAADRVGYESQSAFTAAFRRALGTSPSAYRITR